MIKAQLIELNGVFGKLQIPEMGMDDLYAVLTVKSEINDEVEAIEAKSAKFRDETKPKTAGDYQISLENPENKAWWDKFVAMRMRLLNEEAETSIVPCIPREAFAKMAGGLSTNEAAMMYKYLVRKE